jgi:hypothetical protein
MPQREETWTVNPKLLEIRDQADEILEGIRIIKADIAQLQDTANTEIERIRKRYEQDIYIHQGLLVEFDKQLKTLMKQNRGVLFEDRDLVDLPNGVLIYEKGHKVRIPKGALERIEAQGWMEAIKIVKTVIREIVEKWPDERLAVIGASRKRTEDFSYEIKE